MGKVIERVKITNLLEPGASLEIDAVIDTGATMVVLPQEVVNKLGLRKIRDTKVRYANNKTETKSIYGVATVEIKGRAGNFDVLAETEGSQPLIGQVVLEILDLVVDPRTRTLMPNPLSPEMPMVEILMAEARGSMQKAFRMQDCAYRIAMFWVGSSSMWITVDGRYGLFQSAHPPSPILVSRLGDGQQPTLGEVVFYGSCLAYEHDSPTLVFPDKGKPLVQPLARSSAKLATDSYYGDLCHAYEGLAGVILGNGGLCFRWPVRDFNLEYTREYSRVAKEVSLYGSALRQLDPLSKFLNYYRVIESVSQANGKDWISRNIDRLATYRFGFVEFVEDLIPLSKRSRRTNLFSILRRRALARLKSLKIQLGPRKIEGYFYHENRCGIAHGNQLKEYDFSYTVEAIAQDNYILKLLARIAIGDKLDRR